MRLRSLSACRPSRVVSTALLLAVSLSVLWAAPAQAAPFSIDGTVLDPDGKPVAGATVSVPVATVYVPVTYSVAKAEVQTDDNGRFHFEGERTLPAAAVVNAEADEVADFVLNAAVAAPGLGLAGAPLHVGENTLRLQRGLSLSGLVKTEQGETVADATVRLRFMRPEDPSQYTASIYLESYPAIAALYTVRTGADGRWTCPGLPSEGTVSFVLDDPRFVTANTSVMLSDGRAEAPPLTAKPGVILTGKVLSDDGKPAPDIAVTASTTSGGGYSRGKTNAEGMYTLYGLPEGEYNIRAEEIKGEWITPGLERVATHRGQPAAVPDIKLGRGLLLEGTVVDAETEEPIAGAMVMSQSSYGSTRGTISDADGRYTIRVLPGQIRFYVANTPPDYVRDEFGGGNVTVSANQKTVPPRRLKRGLTVRGTAVDEAGKPATGAVLKLGQSYMGAQTRVGEKGTWILRGINPDMEHFGPQREGGGLKLTTDGEWQIVKPATVILPAERPVEVVLRRIKLLTLEGRVVTPQGEPVPDANVKIKVALDAENPGGGLSFRQKTTDAQGRFRLAYLRPENAVSLTVDKPGFAFVRGGKVENKGGRFSAEDLVLAPKQTQLTGQVLDANGTPVPEARVLLAGTANVGETPIRADAQGRFTFKNLAEGESTVMAASGRAFGQATANTGREATIVLKPGQEPKSQDMARSVELLTQWIREDDERDKTAPPAGRRTWRPEKVRSMTPILAARDPDLALRLATAPDGSIEDRPLSEIIRRLAKSDPRRAATWAPPHLDKIKLEFVRTVSTIDLALAVVDIDSDLSRQLMESVAATVNPKDFSVEAANKFAYLAAIASKLKDPRVDLWMEALQVAVEQQGQAGRQPDSVSFYTNVLMRGDIALAEKLLAAQEPAVQLRTLETLIPAIARRDLPAARRLLATMEALAARPDLQVEPKDDREYRPTPQQKLERAYYAVALALAPTEPQAALELARKISANQIPTMRSEAIATAAGYLKGEAAAQAFREAAEGNPYYRGFDVASRVAAMAYQQDPALAEELFAIARKNLATPESYGDDENMRLSFATYAFYRAAIDPAESRLLLENEWARRKAAYERGKTGHIANMSGETATHLLRVAHAMIAVDPERALQMGREAMTIEGAYVDVRPLFIAFLLAPDATRRTMRFEDYPLEDE